MQVTYLVLVHQQPQQLAALLDVLLVQGARAVVHVDAKADEAPFRRAIAHHGQQVSFTEPRHAVNWGGFGAVAATVSALRRAVLQAPGDYYALISGADLPIKPASALHAELASGAVYLTAWAMPSTEHHKPLSRLEHFNVAGRNRYSRVAYRLNRQVLQRLPKRDIARGLGGAQPYAGSQWWVLPHPCAEQILAFVDRSPRFVRFFRYSQVPDEMFFQTIVKALPHPWDVRPNLTYADWSDSSTGGMSPRTLNSADLPTLAASDRFFARKFDHDGDPEVYAAVRTQLLGLLA